MDVAAACAVGRIGPDGPWVGFAPTLDDGYALVIGRPGGGARRVPAVAEDLLALAVLYFDETLAEPPEALAATHGDIGSLVRHVAQAQARVHGVRRRELAEAVDAIDDGLGADAVIARLVRCLPEGEEPLARLERRASEVAVD